MRKNQIQALLARYIEGGEQQPPAAATPPGATDGATSASQQPGGTNTGSEAPKPSEVPPRAAESNTGGDEGQSHPWDNPESARAEIERLRRENGSARTQAKQTAAEQARESLVNEIGRALGLVKDEGDKAPSVEDLTKQVTTAQDAANQAQLELAVFRSAPDLGADPAALLDSRTFLEKVAGLDRSAENFGQQLSDAIKAQVESNPRLKAAGGQGPQRSGAEINGGNQEPARGQSPQELADLIRKNRTNRNY